MSWPNATDYQDALQNPGFCFADPELKTGQVRANRLGPILESGSFACVSRITNGTDVWAVRCFLGEIPDRQARYRAIHKHLRSQQLPYFAQFEFLDQGIRTHGAWYPILKMEWVQGVPLDNFVLANLENPGELKLADKWLMMARDLRSAGIAHGDLQHGNILVSPAGELKLIDYDGMFVPELAGKESNELGNPAYQHPQRSRQHYSATMDAFSGWIIYGTLVALATAPNLWSATGAGDGRLLFSRADYADPRGSAALQILEASEGTAAELAEFVQKLVQDDPSKVPELTSENAEFLTKSAGMVEKVDDWLAHFFDLREGPPGAEPATTRPGWLQDYYVETGPRVPPFHIDSERTACRAALLFALCGSGLTWASVGLFVPGLALFLASSLALIAFLALRYRAEPAVTQRGTHQLLVSREKGRLKYLNGETRQVERDLNELLEKVKRDLERIRRDFEGEQATQNSEITAANHALQTVIAAIDTELVQINRSLDQALTQALKTMQEEHVHRLLSMVRLNSAPIRGIGDEMKRRLMSEGIRSAADFVGVTSYISPYGSYGATETWIQLKNGKKVQVYGIGSTRGAGLLAWRQAAEQRARQGMPRELSATQREDTVRQSDAQRRTIESRRPIAKNSNQEELRKIRAKYQSIGKLRATKESAVRVTADEPRIGFLERLHELRRKQSDARWALARAERELTRYGHVTFWRYLRRVMVP